MNALKTFIGQLAENLAKQPGWIPLLILSYVLLPLAGHPVKISAFGHAVELSDEFLAATLTLVFYCVGDALDKCVYKPLERRLPSRFLVKVRQDAQNRLKIQDGIYVVAKAVASAARSIRSTLAHFLNELAKFLRSLVAPAVGVGIWCALSRETLWAEAFIAGGVVLIPIYAVFKAAHMRTLYQCTERFVADRKFHVEDVGGMRLFFWDGALVGSALRK